MGRKLARYSMRGHWRDDVHVLQAGMGSLFSVLDQ